MVAWLPLEHVVSESLQEISLKTAARIEVDASPWGGGGVLFEHGTPTEYWTVAWKQRDASELDTVIGQPSGQTSWELLALLVSLILWGRRHRAGGLALLGDNLASLESALHLRGRGVLSRIARELSWRRAREGWRYVVGHLPTERNKLADALSRLAAPAVEHRSLPPELKAARAQDAPEIASIWTL